MCTVTFIPLTGHVFITHNRDEKQTRSKAITPKEYIINNNTLVFPRDSDAGGSWIAINKNGNAAVLLNGAFVKHVHEPPYRRSRGLSFLDIMCSSDLYLSFHKTDLSGIEPFTVILYTNSELFECRWDGSGKHSRKMDAALPHTWSSVTLYDDAVIERRQSWFTNWLPEHEHPTMDDIIQFHLSAGDGDSGNDLRMNRNGQMLTVSITSIEITASKSLMKYIDLQDNTTSLQELVFTKAPVTK